MIDLLLTEGTVVTMDQNGVSLKTALWPWIRERFFSLAPVKRQR